MHPLLSAHGAIAVTLPVVDSWLGPDEVFSVVLLNIQTLPLATHIAAG
jgi:hypothetical protein